jgi:hypothetical protein
VLTDVNAAVRFFLGLARPAGATLAALAGLGTVMWIVAAGMLLSSLALFGALPPTSGSPLTSSEKEHDMTVEDLVRSWKDPDSRDEASADHPAGQIQLSAGCAAGRPVRRGCTQPSHRQRALVVGFAG